MSSPYAHNDLDEEVDTSDSESSPEIPIANLRSPPAALLPLNDVKTFGIHPLDTEAPIIRCPDCSKPILASAIDEHAKNCERIRNGGIPKDEEETGASAPTLSKKRSAEDALGPSPATGEKGPSPKKHKKASAKSAVKKGPKVIGKGARTKGPLDFDRQCGVPLGDAKPGQLCTRSITCKVHSMTKKRQVTRSRPYEELVIEYKKLLDPNYVEPPKKETKAERREKALKEKEEKRARDIELGLIPPPGEKKKKQKKVKEKLVVAKKKKDKQAKRKESKRTASEKASKEKKKDKAEESEIDSDAEAEMLIDSVRRARGLVSSVPISPTATDAPPQTPHSPVKPVFTGAGHRFLGSPMASPLSSAYMFAVRNETLRSCSEIMLKALQHTPSVSGSSGGSLANRWASSAAH